MECRNEESENGKVNSVPSNIVKPRKIIPQNVVLRLKHREIYGYGKPGTHFQEARQFYQTVFPNFTVVNVEKPPCFLRKFSPDGKYFIAFSADQTAVEVYGFNGSAAAGDLLQDLDGDYLHNGTDAGRSYTIRSRVFERFFKLHYVIKVCTGIEQLNRECSLFCHDGRHLIVGAAAYIPEDLRPHFYQIYTSNEAVTPNHRSPLEDYSLYLVDLVQGKLCDLRKFEVDKIFLSHNQGLYLYRDILAVLSVQHQQIYVFQILDGMFINIRRLGRFCYEDDAYFISNVFPIGRPFRDVYISSLKHRILAFLYYRAVRLSAENRNEIRKFYVFFDNFRSLRMWKMQLLDRHHLLIKYASEDVVTLKSTEPNSSISFFVIYNMADAKVLEVFENTSSTLLELFENFCDIFRNMGIYMDSKFICSPSNNLFARLLQRRFKHTIESAKFGGKVEATKRLLSQLPISAQSFSSSPYLDLALFSYDDKWISLMERPKSCGEHPIRFYARDSGLLKFRIYAGIMGRKAPPAARRLVAFTFHPTEPFAISVQRTNSEYIVNFHIRHAG